jgi:double zinc ribbon protein
MSKMPCTSCGLPNEPGTRFCTRCGTSLEARAHCPSCNHVQAAGNQFCMSCGAGMSGARWEPEGDRGAVIGGVWERGDGELIRRVDPEDCRTFLGARTVRVPPGTVGVVLVDGLVERILPPGEQTSVSLFERITRFFSGKTGDRTALYLVDLRPVPVPFAVRTRPGSGGDEAETQVVVSFSFQRGDKEGMASFIANVLGARESYTARDLYDLVRPEVSAIATQVLERLGTQDGGFTYEAAEAAIRAALELRLARYGLTLSVTVAPLTTTTSLSFCLGTGEAPEVRPCGKCSAELPASMKFCDRCGAPQPTMVSPARVCSKCSARVAASDGFCSTCGTIYVAPPATATPLFTADGARVEIDLVVRVQGQHADFTPERLAIPLVGAVAAHLRTVSFAALASAAGFAAAELAIRAAAEQGLASFGLVLVAAAVVDVRDKRGQWILGARADLARARDEVLLGREWLRQREGAIDLEELTFAQRLASQRVEREARLAARTADLDGARREAAIVAEDAFTRDQASLDDRRRREAISIAEAELDSARAERGADRDRRIAAAEQSVELAKKAFRREGELGDQAHAATLARGALDLDAEKRRQAIDLASEAARRSTEDAAIAARSQKDVAFEDHARRAHLGGEIAAAEQTRQLAKLAAMAELDRKMAEEEHAQKRELRESLKGLSEREMIAAQATELARTEGGGAAWAAALAGDEARRLAAEHAAKLEGVMAQQLDRLEHLTTSALASAAQRAGGTDHVYESSMESMSRVAASRAAPTPAIVAATTTPGTPCKNPECRAILAPGALFCGTCGTSQ